MIAFCCDVVKAAFCMRGVCRCVLNNSACLAAGSACFEGQFLHMA